MKENNTLTMSIYYALKDQKHTIGSLFAILIKAGYKISERSVYRHVQKIEAGLDPAIEAMEIELGSYNKKSYSIRKLSKPNNSYPSSNSEWISHLFDQYLHLKTAHQFIVSEADFTKINNSQLPMAPAKVREMMGFKSFMNAFENSRFGQTNLTTSQKSILLDFLWSIDNKKCIKITSFIPLTTHQHQLIPGVNELLNPVKIIYHRGDFIITIIENETKMVYSFELDKIEKIKLTDISFEYSSTKEERDIKNNFGYHSTINSRIYKIKLLFPPTPGGYVMNRKWHGSQQFHIRKNGFIEMKFSSRICIELLGWIMMWMDNVEVLGPQKLNDIISVKLKNMSKINNHKILPINNSDNQVASK